MSLRRLVLSEPKPLGFSEVCVRGVQYAIELGVNYEWFWSSGRGDLSDDFETYEEAVADLSRHLRGLGVELERK